MDPVFGVEAKWDGEWSPCGNSHSFPIGRWTRGVLAVWHLFKKKVQPPPQKNRMKMISQKKEPAQWKKTKKMWKSKTSSNPTFHRRHLPQMCSDATHNSENIWRTFGLLLHLRKGAMKKPEKSLRKTSILWVKNLKSNKNENLRIWKSSKNVCVARWRNLNVQRSKLSRKVVNGQGEGGPNRGGG